MERNREARRGTIPAASNGLSRRRQRNSSLRDSPEEEGAVSELQEMTRLRDRVSKKDRDRSSRSKRRRGERLLHGSNREDGGDDSTEESIDDDEEEDDEDGVVSISPSVRLPLMNPVPPGLSSSASNHHHHHNQQRKSFPPKVMRAAGPPWKAADEMIGVAVPRKARSASAKRSHECWISGGGNGGGNGEQALRQASMSPARPSTMPSAPAAPISPSSSNASGRKKMKTIGAKQKPPKISKATSSSSIQEIEIEVAEVLFGMTRQFQCPPKQETSATTSHKLESKDANGSSNDTKSRVSSPVSASSPPAPQPYMPLQNSSSTVVPPSAVAPKRKRPRPVKLEEENPAILSGPNASISSAAKVEVEQPEAVENSPLAEKNGGSTAENDGESSNFGSSQVHLEQDSVKLESDLVPESKPLISESNAAEGIQTNGEISSPTMESLRSRLDVNLNDAAATKADSTACAVESLREEKFKFDLMALPSGKSSPERVDGAPGFTSEPKPTGPEVDVGVQMAVIEAEDAKVEIAKMESGESGSEEKKAEVMAAGVTSQKQIAKERTLDLQLDSELQEKDSMSSSSRQHVLKQQQQSKATRIETKAEKSAQAAALPLPMTVPGWPGSLPLGYMGQVPSIQALVSMDRSTGSSATIQLPHFARPQPRPKRCATHFYVAKNIYYHQQFARMNPFWPSAAGSPAMCGTKPCNVNTVPPTESALLLNPLQGGFAARNMSPLQDKGPATALSGHSSKEKSSPATTLDSSQRKQLMLQQGPQPASVNNILPAPAFIFPMTQQHAAATPAARSGTVKSAATISYASPSTGAANSIGGPVPSSGPATPMTVSFNYANLSQNDAQYMAMIQNNSYPFPIPAPVGAPLPFSGNPAQAVPFFNGPFYPTQMLHPSQLQQQQHPHSQPPTQQGHQNAATSSGSSSSQKHQQQQHILQGCNNNSKDGSSQSFPTLKQRQQQQQLQPQNQHLPPHQSRHLESMCSEDGPSTSDGRVHHAQKNASNHNFAMPIHPQNFTLMSPAMLGGGNQGGEKQQQQHQNMKGGMELTPSQAFAMSFASFNGPATTSSLDFSAMAQNHPLFQSLPEAARRGYQMAAASTAAQIAQKNHQNMEERRAVNESINPNASSEEEKKAVAGKASAQISRSLVFSRPESEQQISTILGNGLMDSSARTLNIIPAPTNGNCASSRPGSGSSSTATATTPIAPNPTHQHHQQLIQLQKQQQQQQQHQQQQQQHQQQQLVAHSKAAATNNANVYSDRLPSSLMSKSPNTVSVFPQALIQGSNANQSPQWKNSIRTGTSPGQSPSTAPMQSMKSLPQQQGRVQVRGLPSANHTQISFGAAPKVVPSGQQLPATNPSPPSAGLGVGSPSTSISKNAGGSPRTGTGSKVTPSAAAFPAQSAKGSQPSSSSKSSPVGGRNVPSILSNSQATSAQSSSVKAQQHQQQNQHHQQNHHHQQNQQQQQAQLQQQQAQLHKQPFQQAQLFFSNAYMQAQSPHSTANPATGYYQRRQSEQQQQQNSPVASSTGTTSVGSPSLTTPSSAPTSDPAKAAAAAAAAAANNMKTLPPPSLLQAAQFAAQSTGNMHPLMPAAFPYIHAMPAVPVKPAEQKPAAGNDNLNASSWQPEKR